MEELNQEREPGELYTIGKLIQDSLSVVKKNIKILSVFVLVSMLLMVAMISFTPHFFFSPEKITVRAIPPLIFFCVIGFIPGIALIFALDNLIDGNPITLGKSFEVAFKKIFPYLLVFILLVLAIISGLILLIIPGIIFGVWFGFSTYALIIENRTGLSAFRRSKQLVKGNGWYVFVVSLILIIIFDLVTYGSSAIIWMLSHLIAKTPLNLKFFNIFRFIFFIVIAWVPLIAANLLLFKNLRNVKGDNIIAVSYKFKASK